MHEIHELLDPGNAIHSVGKSFDHTVELTRQSVSKAQSMVTQGDFKYQKLAESYEVQIRELNNLNLA